MSVKCVVGLGKLYDNTIDGQSEIGAWKRARSKVLGQFEIWLFASPLGVLHWLVKG